MWAGFLENQGKGVKREQNTKRLFIQWKLEIRAYIKHKLPQIPRKIGINAMFPIQYGMIFRTNILHILACFNDMFTYILHIIFLYTRNSHAWHTVLQHVFVLFYFNQSMCHGIFSDRLTSSFNNSIVFHHMEVSQLILVHVDVNWLFCYCKCCTCTKQCNTLMQLCMSS